MSKPIQLDPWTDRTVTIETETGGNDPYRDGPVSVTMSGHGVRIATPEGDVRMTWREFATWALYVDERQALRREHEHIAEEKAHAELLRALGDQKFAQAQRAIAEAPLSTVCSTCGAASILPAATPEDRDWERGYNDAMRGEAICSATPGYAMGYQRGQLARRILAEAEARRAPCVLPCETDDQLRQRGCRPPWERDP